MKTMPRVALTLATALAVTVLTTGCNNTVQQLSIPSNATWNVMAMPIASPYTDLEILTAGSDLEGQIIDGPGGPFAYCSNGNDAGIIEGDTCPAGYNLLGLRYFYLFAVSLNRPAFQAGGVDLVSAAAGTVYSLSLAVNTSTNNVYIAAGASDGVIPLSSQNPPTWDQFIAADDYAGVFLAPPDPGFADAAYGPDPNFPDFACQSDGPEGADAIFMRVTTARTASYACGALTFNLAVSPQYPNLGQCISDSIIRNCKDQGLTGKARATCNKQQQSVCRAMFNS
jgi:hypothetical protein